MTSVNAIGTRTKRAFLPVLVSQTDMARRMKLARR
jgi:hypothetical protein